MPFAITSDRALLFRPKCLYLRYWNHEDRAKRLVGAPLCTVKTDRSVWSLRLYTLLKSSYFGLLAVLLSIGACSQVDSNESGVSRGRPERAGDFLYTASPYADFGTMLQGDRAQHEFKLEVVGDDPLALSRVIKSCGCTSAEVFVLQRAGELVPYELGTSLPQGTELRVQARFSSNGKSGATKSLIRLVSSSHPKSFVLTLFADVGIPIQVDPPIIDLGNVLIGKMSLLML